MWALSPSRPGGNPARDIRMFESGPGTTPATGNIVGHVRVLPDVRSPQLRNTRDIQVYLPPSYKASGRQYPVIYMHDGQNLFDPELSFAGEWGVDETMERLAPEGFEAIVVAIPNMAGERSHEYSPWVDPRVGGGKGDAYLDFIVDTLKPQIDRRFRTERGRQHTGIVGSSMGGLISLYARFSTTPPASSGGSVVCTSTSAPRKDSGTCATRRACTACCGRSARTRATRSSVSSRKARSTPNKPGLTGSRWPSASCYRRRSGM
jgi:hypothetical protein